MEEENWIKNGWLAEEKVPQEKKVYKKREREKEREYMHVRFAQHPHIGLYLIVFMAFLRGCSLEENES